MTIPVSTNYSIDCRFSKDGQRAKKLCHHANDFLHHLIGVADHRRKCELHNSDAGGFWNLFSQPCGNVRSREKPSRQQSPKPLDFMKCVACAGLIFGDSRIFFFFFQINFFSLFSPRPLQRAERTRQNEISLIYAFHCRGKHFAIIGRRQKFLFSRDISSHLDDC